MFLTLLSILGSSHASESVAILDTQNTGKMANVEFLLNSTFRKSSLTFFEGTHFTTITKENMIENFKDGDNLSCLEDTNCYIQVGQAIGADYVIVSEFLKINDATFIVTEAYHTYSWSLICSENFIISENNYPNLTSDSFMADHFTKIFSSIKQFSIESNNIGYSSADESVTYLLEKYDNFELRKNDILTQKQSFEEKLEELKNIEKQQNAIQKQLKLEEEEREKEFKVLEEQIDKVAKKVWNDVFFSNLRLENSEFSNKMIQEFISDFYGVPMILESTKSPVDYSSIHIPNEVRFAALQLNGSKKVCFFELQQNEEMPNWIEFPSKNPKECIPTARELKIAKLSRYFTTNDLDEARSLMENREQFSFQRNKELKAFKLSRQQKIVLWTSLAYLATTTVIISADNRIRENNVDIHSFLPLCWSTSDGDNYRYECL
jgi:hypothetical protein